MEKKKLLCVAPGRLPPALEEDGAWDDWEIHHVSTLKDAERALRSKKYPVCLIYDGAGSNSLGQMDSFLREHWSTSWVGLFSPNALAEPRCRRLVGDHLADFHTLPVDAIRLRHTLGHAHGLASFRSRPEPGRISPGLSLQGSSDAILQLREQIGKVALSDAPVLIWGESGSGKELTAQAIHEQSTRSAGPFVPVNCGAIPATLIQSELFGHERGAFTGAARDKRGLIESASGGTIFLDEIGDLPMELQSNLLRFLQEKTITRLGSTRTIAADARVIAASHVNLQVAMEQKRFREDLFYRLNVLTLSVPPLRERKDDVVLLANHFFSRFASERAPRVKGFSSQAYAALVQHDWPGNVRELINRVRRAMVMADGHLIAEIDLGLVRSIPINAAEGLDDARLRAERAVIDTTLSRAGKNISQTARELGISRMTLYRLLAKHGIEA